MEEEETGKVESHLSSAAAFVEGGIQDPCDYACSICLEDFCESDPSSVTNCKHEFHLHCILEWCQRSSQCPMCWQSISLKDPTSQELLEAVERERKFRSKRPRATAIFHHPTLGDFELQHLPIGANDADLEERIFQHLAAAAAMGRARLARRDGRHGRSGAHSRPQYLVFSADSNSVPAGPIAASSDQRGEEDLTSLHAANSTSITHDGAGVLSSSPLAHAVPTRPPHFQAVSLGSNGLISNMATSNNQSSSSHVLENQDRAGPSDIQSLAESFKSRLSSFSTKYKESIAKSTRGWRERIFARNNSVAAEISSDIRREVNAGITTVSHMIERLDIRESSRGQNASESNNLEGHQISELRNERSGENQTGNVNRNMDASTSCGASSL